MVGGVALQQPHGDTGPCIVVDVVDFVVADIVALQQPLQIQDPVPVVVVVVFTVGDKRPCTCCG